MQLLRKFVQPLRVRPRLMIATAVGLALLVCLPSNVRGATRALIAWDLGAGLYLVLAWSMMLRAGVAGMRKRARLQDDGALVILALTVSAAVASLAALVLELSGLKYAAPHVRTVHLVLAAITILCSFCIVHTAFALHYAHEFYGDGKRAAERCLEFPRTEQPDYFDFLYFAFVLGTTSQTSDVTIASSPLRRLALMHGVIAFFFNTTVLALMVNIAATLMS